jgi:hypothetical protein
MVWAPNHVNRTVADWTSVLFTDKSRFCLDHTDGCVRMSCMPRERLHVPWCWHHPAWPLWRRVTDDLGCKQYGWTNQCDRYGEGSLMIWGRSSMAGRINLTVMARGLWWSGAGAVWLDESISSSHSRDVWQLSITVMRSLCPHHTLCMYYRRWLHPNGW